jgi:UDP-N-acetyl-D-mannosaminuronate dehydrogenase
VNDGQPEYVVEIISHALGGLKGRCVAALGLAYKPDVDDLRESPAIEVARILAAEGARVKTLEPFALEASIQDGEAAVSLEEALREADAVVLLVDHQTFREVDPRNVATAMPGRVAIDTRGVWDRETWEQAGFRLTVLGVGTSHD